MKNSRLENTFSRDYQGSQHLCKQLRTLCCNFFFYDQCFPKSAKYVGLSFPLKWLRWHLQHASHFTLQLSQFKHVILTADAQGTFWHSGIHSLKCLTWLSIRRTISMIWGWKQRQKYQRRKCQPGRKGKYTKQNNTQAFRYTASLELGSS